MENGLIILGIAIILVAVCGCTQSPAPVQPTPTFSTETSAIPLSATYHTTQTTNLVSENTVRINDFTFEPADITVKAGSIVRWVNRDHVPHRIKFEDEHFSQMLLGSSQSESQKFNDPGVYPYTCLIHPEMHGTVIVE